MNKNIRGGIHNLDAYARGKFLDHSDWIKHLSNNRTPSDIDAIMNATETAENITALDKYGKVLLMEFSTKTATWDKLKYGQRMLYENIVRAGNRNILAVLAYVQPQPNEPINTVKDVIAFSILRLDRNNRLDTSTTIPNDKGQWIEFVKNYQRL